MLSREWGKYAHLRVQVDLIKHILAMFSIKGQHYKVKCEGLHLCASLVEDLGMKQKIIWLKGGMRQRQKRKQGSMGQTR